MTTCILASLLDLTHDSLSDLEIVLGLVAVNITLATTTVLTVSKMVSRQQRYWLAHTPTTAPLPAPSQTMPMPAMPTPNLAPPAPPAPPLPTPSPSLRSTNIASAPPAATSVSTTEAWMPERTRTLLQNAAQLRAGLVPPPAPVPAPSPEPIVRRSIPAPSTLPSPSRTAGWAPSAPPRPLARPSLLTSPVEPHIDVDLSAFDDDVDVRPPRSRRPMAWAIGVLLLGLAGVGAWGFMEEGIASTWMPSWLGAEEAASPAAGKPNADEQHLERPAASDRDAATPGDRTEATDARNDTKSEASRSTDAPPGLSPQPTESKSLTNEDAIPSPAPAAVAVPPDSNAGDLSKSDRTDDSADDKADDVAATEPTAEAEEHEDDSASANAANSKAKRAKEAQPAKARSSSRRKASSRKKSKREAASKPSAPEKTDPPRSKPAEPEPVEAVIPPPVRQPRKDKLKISDTDDPLG